MVCRNLDRSDLGRPGYAQPHRALHRRIRNPAPEVKIVAFLFSLVAVVGVVAARESILSFPIPNANREPRARLYTDNLYEQDFKIDHKHILAEYFTGGDSNLLASFRQEFEKLLYIDRK